MHKRSCVLKFGKQILQQKTRACAEKYHCFGVNSESLHQRINLTIHLLRTAREVVSIWRNSCSDGSTTLTLERVHAYIVRDPCLSFSFLLPLFLSPIHTHTHTNILAISSHRFAALTPEVFLVSSYLSAL